MGLAYERAGSGEPLILIHGLGGTRRIWDPVLDRLASERDVITVDLPGFGDSPPLRDRPATAANLGVEVSALAGLLGLSRPHLGANSLGAWAALEIAKAGAAASVCAISPAGLWRRPLGPRSVNTRALGLRLRPLLGPLMRFAGVRERLLRTTVAHPERLTRVQATALVRGWLDSSGYDEANEQMRAHVFEHPELVRVPTTIAWGTEDRLVAPPRRERMPPGARYVVLEGCGHTPTWDDPGRVAELLLEASAGEPEGAEVAAAS